MNLDQESAELDRVLILVDGCSDFRHDFDGWLRDNIVIWERFELEATRTWMAGRRHYSARTLIEYIRHDTMLSEASGEWKINGNFVPDLSRLYMLAHPDRAGFFELRHQAGPNAASAGVRGQGKATSPVASAPVAAEHGPVLPLLPVARAAAPAAAAALGESSLEAGAEPSTADLTSDFLAFASEGMDTPASMY